MTLRDKLYRELARTQVAIRGIEDMLKDRCSLLSEQTDLAAKQIEFGTVGFSSLGIVQGEGSNIDTLCAQRAAYKEFEKALVGLLEEDKKEAPHA